MGWAMLCLRPPHRILRSSRLGQYLIFCSSKLNIQYFCSKILNIFCCHQNSELRSGNVQHSLSSETQYSIFSGLKDSNIQYSPGSETQHSIFSDFKTQYSIFNIQYSVWWSNVLWPWFELEESWLSSRLSKLLSFS